MTVGLPMRTFAVRVARAGAALTRRIGAAFLGQKEPLKTGASVLVISVDTESETVEVVSTSNVEGLPP
jgi:hypothetical protein